MDLELVKTLVPLILGFTGIFASIVVYKAQRLNDRRTDVASKFLSRVYEYRMRMHDFRRPGFWSAASQDPSEDEKKYADGAPDGMKDWAIVRFRRRQPLIKAIDELSVLMPDVMAVFGSQTDSIFVSIFNVNREVFEANNKFLVKEEFYTERTGIDEKREKRVRDLSSEHGDNDPITILISTIVKDAEKLCRPYLKTNNLHFHEITITEISKMVDARVEEEVSRPSST